MHFLYALPRMNAPDARKTKFSTISSVFVLVLTKIKPCVSGLHENMKRNPNKKCKPAYSLKSAYSTAVSHKSGKMRFRDICSSNAKLSTIIWRQISCAFSCACILVHSPAVCWKSSCSRAHATATAATSPMVHSHINARPTQKATPVLRAPASVCAPSLCVRGGCALDFVRVPLIHLQFVFASYITQNGGGG